LVSARFPIASTPNFAGRTAEFIGQTTGPSFTTHNNHSREGGNPVPPLDTRLRGCDGLGDLASDIKFMQH
jgi:hypothetical protein